MDMSYRLRPYLLQLAQLDRKLPQNIAHTIIHEAVGGAYVQAYPWDNPLTLVCVVEKSFVCDALPVSLIGMNEKMMSEYIEFVADRYAPFLFAKC
jgi:hypothetical protein